MKLHKIGSQLKMGIVLSYINMGLAIITSLVYTPVMIKALGQSEYGLYNMVASTISVMSILSLGFNSGYIKYYASYKNENDTTRIYKLNGLFLEVFLFLGVIVLLCGLFLMKHLEIVFSGGLGPDEYSLARTLLLIMTISLAIEFPMIVFSTIISANEKFVALKLVQILKTIASPMITMPLLLCGYKSVAMVLVSTIVTIGTDLIYVYYVVFVLKNKFYFKDFDKGLLQKLFLYTSFIAINMIVSQINSNVDKILLARYQGTKEVAVYAVGYSVYTYFMMFSTPISSSFTPMIHRIIVQHKRADADERKELTELFTKVGRIQFLILGLIFSGVILFGYEFIVGYWAGDAYTNSYSVCVMLMIAGLIPMIQDIGTEIQRAKNVHKISCFIYLGVAIMNVIISIPLCKEYGAIGSAVGTCVTMLIGNALIINIIYKMRCNIDIIYFWKKILSMLPGISISVVVGITLKYFMGFETAGKFLAGVFIYTVIYLAAVWKFSMNDYEKNLILRYLRK